jgi:hypothetical protein
MDLTRHLASADMEQAGSLRLPVRTPARSSPPRPLARLRTKTRSASSSRYASAFHAPARPCAQEMEIDLSAGLVLECGLQSGARGFELTSLSSPKVLVSATPSVLDA